MKALRELGAKDVFTAGNLACGLLAIFTALGFFSNFWQSVLEPVIPPALTSSDLGVSSFAAAFIGAWILVVLALVFDLLDGKIARAPFTKMSDRFGKEFDSLADIISFGVAPALITAMHFPASFDFDALGARVVGFAGLFFYVFCGCVRLARFNLQEEKDCYYGLPIPAAALFMLAASLAADKLAWPEVSWVAFFALGALMVSRFKIKKLF